MAQKLPLGGTAVGKADIAGDVFHHQAALQHVLRLGDVGYQTARCLVGVGQGVEVVQHGVAQTAPAQMVRHPQGLNTLGELFDLLHIGQVQPIGAAQGHGHAMHDHGVIAADEVEHL